MQNHLMKGKCMQKRARFKTAVAPVLLATLFLLFTLAGLGAAADTPQVTHSADKYVAGQQLQVTLHIEYSGTLLSLGAKTVLPTGWTYVNNSLDGDDTPGNALESPAGTVEFIYISVPASPVDFSFLVNVPADATGAKTISTLGLYLPSGAEEILEVNATPDPLTVEPIPGVVNVSGADGAYNAGDAVVVSVQFSGAVNVTGIPQLELVTGDSNTIVNYTGGTGTDTLDFTYTVAAGDYSSDLAYAGTGSLTLNGGTIQDGDNNDAILNLPAPGSAGSLDVNSAIVIDTTAPAVAFTKPTGAADYTNALSYTFTGTANSGDVGTAIAYVKVRLNGQGDWTDAVLSARKAEVNWTAALDLVAGQNTLEAYSIDQAGNDSSIQTSEIVYYDTVDPTATLTLAPVTFANGIYWAKEGAITATASFSDDRGRGHRRCFDA